MPRRDVSSRFLGQTLGPAENGGERVVQFVRDAGDGLTECSHLFRLQQLLIQVAGLVVQPTPLADVAHEDFDVRGPVAARRRRMSRHFHPNQIAVQSPQTQQVVRHGAFGKRRPTNATRAAGSTNRLAAKGATASSGVSKAYPRIAFRCGLTARVCPSARGSAVSGTDIDTFVDGLKQTRECVRTGSLGSSFHCRHHGNYRPPCASSLRTHRDDPCHVSLA